MGRKLDLSIRKQAINCCEGQGGAFAFKSKGLKSQIGSSYEIEGKREGEGPIRGKGQKEDNRASNLGGFEEKVVSVIQAAKRVEVSGAIISEQTEDRRRELPQ